MTFGAALVLIAVGAILRFAITTVSTHGIDLRTIGDILMVVGVIGLVLWVFVWGPWARGRRRGRRLPTAAGTAVRAEELGFGLARHGFRFGVSQRRNLLNVFKNANAGRAPKHDGFTRRAGEALRCARGPAGRRGGG